MNIQGWEVTKVEPLEAKKTGPAWWGDPASQQQMNYLSSLVSTADPQSFVTIMMKQVIAAPMTKKQAHDAIDLMKSQPKYVSPVAASANTATTTTLVGSIANITNGIYDMTPHLDQPTTIPGHGRWAIVYTTAKGIKRMKRLYKSWETKSGFSWKQVSPYMATKHMEKIVTGEYPKVPLALIKELGKEVGFCMYCGLTLTDPESRHKGYGPVCAGKFGLPWGH